MDGSRRSRTAAATDSKQVGNAVGLSGPEAARRLAADGPNELPAARPRSLLRQAWDVVRQPMLLLLLGAGTVNFLLAEPLDGAILLSFVVVVIAISIYQEHKTERALAALRDLSSPRALVIRDGQRIRIAGREVVGGDLVLLAEGDRVPADGILVDGVNLSLDESALTGESVPVRKTRTEGDPSTAAMGRPGGDATPWVFSGTLVVKGHGLAVVAHTGARTELGRIGTALRSIESERTPLQREVDRLVRYVAVVGLAAAAIVVVLYGLTRGHWLQGLLAGIATAMAMLPEEFPVVLTVFLALGAWRMSRKHVLTRRSLVIETLGSATVICVDKTGTLTMNAMTVRELIVERRTHVVDGQPFGEPVLGRRVITIATLQGASALAAASGVYLWSVLTDHPDDVVRSVTFATLVLGNLALILVNRSWRLPVLRTLRERRNPTVKWILAAAVALLAAMITISGPREAFNLGPMTATDWLVTIAAAAIGVAWFEIYKTVHRQRV